MHLPDKNRHKPTTRREREREREEEEEEEEEGEKEEEAYCDPSRRDNGRFFEQCSFCPALAIQPIYLFA